MVRIDYTGWRFGMLVAVAPAENSGRRTRWSCRCDCGEEAIVQTSRLVTGTTKSCGCHKAITSQAIGLTAGASNLIAHKISPQGVRRCPRCDQDFPAKGRTVYCSPGCREADAVIGESRCQHCDALMDTLGYRRLYCGRRCKRAEAKKQRLAKLAEARRINAAEAD